MSDVDRFELELYALGEVTDPARVAAIEVAIAGPLADAWATIERDRAEWAPSPLAFPEPSAAPAPRPAWRGWALAAAVLLTLLGAYGLRAPDVAGVRSMGSLPVDAYVQRPNATLGHLDAGDTLGVRTTLPEPGFVAVGLVQPGHGAQLLWVSEERDTGAEVAIPAGLQLDEYSGEEWLVLSLHPTPPDEEAWTMHAAGFVRTHRSDVPTHAVLLRGGRR